MSLPAIIKTGTNVYKIGTELIKVVPKLAKRIDKFLSTGGKNPQIKQKLIKEMKPELGKGLGKKGQVLASVIDQAEKERLRKDEKKKKAQREFNEKEEADYEASKIPPMPKPTIVKVRKKPKMLIEPTVLQPKVKVKPKAPKPKAPKPEEKAPYGTNLFGFALGDPDKPDEPDYESSSVDELEQYDKDIAAYNKRKGLRKGGKVGKKKAGCRAGYGKAMRGY
tara:strand:- start:783 stop:1448 length:666 start_codon:yes stop_codon:yes gene_type:complete